MSPGPAQLGQKASARGTLVSEGHQAHDHGVGPHTGAGWWEGRDILIERDLDQALGEVEPAEGRVEGLTRSGIGVDVGGPAGLRVVEVVHAEPAMPVQMGAKGGQVLEHERVQDALASPGASTYPLARA